MCHVLLPFLKMEINITYKQITDKTTEDDVVNLNMLEVSIYDLSLECWKSCENPSNQSIKVEHFPMSNNFIIMVKFPMVMFTLPLASLPLNVLNQLLPPQQLQHQADLVLIFLNVRHALAKWYHEVLMHFLNWWNKVYVCGQISY